MHVGERFIAFIPIVEGFWVWVIGQTESHHKSKYLFFFFFLVLTHINLTMSKMSDFLENHKLPQLAQDEIEFMAENLPRNKIPRSRWFHWRILPN